MKLRYGIYRNNPIILLHPTDSNFNAYNDSSSGWRYSFHNNPMFTLLPKFEPFHFEDFSTVQDMVIIEYKEYDDDDGGEEVNV